MDVKAALLTAAATCAFVVAACGGGTADPGYGSNASAPSGSSGSGANSSGSGGSVSGSPDRTGTVMGSCGSTPTVTVSWFDSLSWLSFDAPMVFLAQPGSITATLLATPAHDSSWSPFRTYYSFANPEHTFGELGITSDDTAGKSVTTVSIPGQPAGVPIVFSAHFNNNLGAFGTEVMTGFVYENTTNGSGCCDEIVRVAAQVSFGANNTAIVSFLPESGGPTTPLRIQLTNVTSISGCSEKAN